MTTVDFRTRGLDDITEKSIEWCNINSDIIEWAYRNCRDNIKITCKTINGNKSASVVYEIRQRKTNDLNKIILEAIDYNGNIVMCMVAGKNDKTSEYNIQDCVYYLITEAIHPDIYKSYRMR